MGFFKNDNTSKDQHDEIDYSTKKQELTIKNHYN